MITTESHHFLMFNLLSVLRYEVTSSLYEDAILIKKITRK